MSRESRKKNVLRLFVRIGLLKINDVLWINLGVFEEDVNVLVGVSAGVVKALAGIISVELWWAHQLRTPTGRSTADDFAENHALQLRGFRKRRRFRKRYFNQL